VFAGEKPVSRGMIQPYLQIAHRKLRIINGSMTGVSASIGAYTQICCSGAAGIWTVCPAMYLVHSCKKIAEAKRPTHRNLGERFSPTFDHFREEPLKVLVLNRIPGRRGEAQSKSSVVEGQSEKMFEYWQQFGGPVGNSRPGGQLERTPVSDQPF
jgi:hypothetical protein